MTNQGRGDTQLSAGNNLNIEATQTREGDSRSRGFFNRQDVYKLMQVKMLI